MGREESALLLVQVGLRRGCIMFPWLDTNIDGSMKELNWRITGTGAALKTSEVKYWWEVNQLLFPDGTALVVESVEKLKRIVS